MQKAKVLKAGIGTSVVLALSFGLMPAAHADIQPTSTDAVGVGSDTVQYVSDFLDDGDVNLNAGYNSVTANRIFSFDATADASGRAAYLNGTSTALPSSIIERAGTAPTTRPNGSGAGITALLADTNHQIDFVRSSRLPKSSEFGDARATAFGGMHVYRIADDGLDIVADTAATNVPAGLSAQEIVNIYTNVYKKWSDVPGYAGAHPNDGIVPIIPQVGSGTRNDFISDLKTQTGTDITAAVTAGTIANPNLVTGEEHDPTAVTNYTAHTDANGNPVSNADTFSPFSTGRYKLINTGYFGTTPAPNTVSLLTGTSPDGAAAYHFLRYLYIVVRQNDVTSTTPFQVGGSLNLVKSLFGTSTSWYAKSGNAALYQSAGVTRDWKDEGLNPLVP